SAAAAKSALQSVAPFAQGAPVEPSLVRTVQGTAGELLAEQIIATGAKYLFVGNGSGLASLCDALVTRPQLQLIQATHEGQVVAVADGYAKATMKPAFGMFSRVGMMNASANLYNAMKDRTPVIMFSDHAASTSEGRDGGEDLDDWIETVRPFTKWRWVVHEPQRIPEWVRNATKISTVFPMGPTYVRIPRNLLERGNLRAAIFSGKAFEIPMRLSANAKDVEEAARLLLKASSPLMVVGFEVTQTRAQNSLVKLAEMLGMPVKLDRGYGMDFPTAHPLCVGEPRSMNRYPATMDCGIAFGAQDFSGISTSGRIPLIHASVDPEAIGRNAPLSVALLGHLDEVAKQLMDAIQSLANKSELAAKAAERRARIAAYTETARKVRKQTALQASGSPVPWYRLMAELAELSEPDAIVVPELGDDGRVTSFFDFSPEGKWKIGRTRGQSLGWGVGAAAGVSLAYPNRQVIAIQGDGGFLFGQSDSLWTLSRYDMPVMVVILNNLSYEATRWRVMARGTAAGAANRDYISYLGNPEVDFKGLAAAYRIAGETVRNTDQLRPAILKGFRTLKEGRPFLLDVRIKTTGAGADTYWYPKFSVAGQRNQPA
ncbi:MAG TPA: thiamine pyrophosphate-binding protein, partial [Terriglobia bacterium]|nr:thiamine pyrophosphate-binding protein [Terriglobia bacterium]